VEVYEGEYTLETATELDREAPSSSGRLDVAITCRDGGLPARQMTRNVTVTIGDANDHAPTFTQQVRQQAPRQGGALGAYAPPPPRNMYNVK